jgi:DNA-directed RNA polymerase subunit N (RpoN/RPB10)
MNCCAKIKSGKRKGEICNIDITKNKYNIIIDDKTYFVCGKHKKINDICDINIIDINKGIEKIDLNDKIENQENINLNKDIQYPFTIPIRCFTCGNVISKIDIFNKLWEIYNNNINNEIDYINKKLEENNIDKNKFQKDIKNNWWQKIGGFEIFKDGIEIKFIIKNKEWKDIGIDNLCCRRMIYTHEENPLFIYGPSKY